MSSCLDDDIDVTAPVVIEWDCDETTHYLAEPDPKINDITLKIRFISGNAPSGLFSLRLPLNLKGVDGISDVFIPIEASCLDALDFSFTEETASDAVRKKLHANTVRLRFQLNRSLNILVPTTAKQPIAPTRAQSGKVIDALRSLCVTTAFSVYLQATKLSKQKLQTISDAVAQGRLSPLGQQDDLASMYHGMGAKVADLSSRIADDDALPSYNEIEPAPPMAPVNPKKRRRRATSTDESADQSNIILAKLKALEDREIEHFHQLRMRVEALEKENSDLKQQVEPMHKLQQQVEALQKENTELKHEIEQLQADDLKHGTVMEDFECRVLEWESELEELGGKVDYIKENGVDGEAEDGLLSKLKSRVLNDIAKRLSGKLSDASGDDAS